MKRFKSKGLLLSLVIGLTFILTSCGKNENGSPGIYKYLAIPSTYILNGFAKLFGSYGMALILLTVIVRLVLMPIMLHQANRAAAQQVRTKHFQPQINALRKKQKQSKDSDEKTQAGKELMQLYKKHHISFMGGISFLPFLIQIPVFASLYSAIRFSTDLFHSTFLGMYLGQKNIWIAVGSLVMYLLQVYISLYGKSKKERGMIWPMFISPAFIFIISVGAPAGIGIYFFIGGIFICLQAILNKLNYPKIERKVNAHMKNESDKDTDSDNWNQTSSKEDNA